MSAASDATMEITNSKSAEYEQKDGVPLEKQLSRPAHIDESGRPVLTVAEVGDASKRALNFRSIFAMVVFGCSSFMFGYDNGIIGSLVALPLFVQKYQGDALNADGILAFTAKNQNLLFSVPLVGSIFGAVLATPLQNKCGRKWGLVYAYAFSIGGVILQLFAPSLAGFVIGRFWNALSYGAATAIVPLLLGDIVPPSIRGAAVQASSIAAIGSGLIGNLIIFGTDKLDSAWSYHVPLIIQAVFPIGLAVLTVFCVESPTWYVQKGRLDEARKALRSIRGYSDAQVDDELRIIVTNETKQRELTGDVKFWDIFHRSQIKRTIVAGSLFSLNQISGIILSTTYATIFLQQLKIGNPFSLAVVASCTQLAGSLTAPFVVDRAGRRPLALIGFTCLFVIDMAAGGLAFDGSVGARKGVAALGFIFNFVWCCSFYSLSLLMPSEIATPRLRSATMSYAVGWGQTTAVITTFAVPQLTQPDAANLGPKTYLVFGGCMACIIVFVYFFLPETARRTFAEIDEMYEYDRAHGLPMRKWKKFETSPESKLATVVGDDVPTVHL